MKMSTERMALGEMAATNLITKGYAFLDVDKFLAGLIDNVFNAGEAFFALNDSIKHKSATPSVLEGYRPIGQEYSQTPDRPDLAEAFTLWPRNSGRVDVLRWASSLDLHEKMKAVIEPFCEFAGAILNSVGSTLNKSTQPVSFKDMSYVQLNRYEPARYDRDFLQDRHEDGHLITLVTATGKGLEVEIDGEFMPVDSARGQFIVMPGSLMTVMTGGTIPAMHHRVRTHRDIVSRQSLMFFVNPSLDIEIVPWVVTESNKGIDVRQVAVANSSHFGLAALTEIQSARDGE